MTPNLSSFFSQLFLFPVPCNSSTATLDTSRAFRKFVISYGRVFGHDILGYREQSRDEFSRPFGKEAPYANAHCSPYHFSAQGPVGATNFSPSPFHPAITGLTGSHDLTGGCGGAADQPAHRPRVGVFQPDGGQMATALPGAGLPRFARCPSLRAAAHSCVSHARPGHLGGQRFASRPGSPRHAV